MTEMFSSTVVQNVRLGESSFFKFCPLEQTDTYRVTINIIVYETKSNKFRIKLN